MRRDTIRKLTGIFISALIVLVASSGSFRKAYSIPDMVTVAAGQPFVIETGLPIVSVYSRNASQVDYHPIAKVPTRVVVDTSTPGRYSLEFRLLGVIPLRKVDLYVQQPPSVIPGGHSIGVVLRSSGLIITGISPVVAVDGREVWPAKNAGLEVGDIILSIGDRSVSSREELAIAVEKAGLAGEWVDLLVEKADGTTVRKLLWPARHRDGGFKLGIAVKDSLAGVGTLTFFDPQSRVYAALGHVIAEGDSKRPVTMKEGHIVRATVTGVQPSKKGEPGEILGVFVEGQDVIGTIIKNGPCGIAGALKEDLSNPYYPHPVPIAFQHEVKRGPAVLLTTIGGRQIQKFDVEIEQIFPGAGPSSKGFVIRITDPKLISTTGGIVQGMSGSPIIQEGKLIGAVTHVLVNDPTRGYGTFAEWMAQEAYIRVQAAEARELRAAFCETPQSDEF